MALSSFGTCSLDFSIRGLIKILAETWLLSLSLFLWVEEKAVIVINSFLSG